MRRKTSPSASQSASLSGPASDSDSTRWIRSSSLSCHDSTPSRAYTGMPFRPPVDFAIPLVSNTDGMARPSVRQPRLTRDERKRKTRADLLLTARRLFEERGFHGASLEDIAD